MTLLRREREHWELLAAGDPMWVILTEPGKETTWNESEFFESGRQEVARTLSTLGERFSLRPRLSTALDFGCGIGRLTQALAEKFPLVHGVDISARMIDAARSKNRHGPRVVYHVNASDQLGMLSTASINFIYTRLTLQHIPNATASKYVQEFARVLAPEGIAMFQALTRARRWTVRARHRVRDAMPNAYRWLRDLVSRKPRWEMNVLGEEGVLRALEGTGARLLGSFEDDSTRDEFESRFFVVVRD